MSGRFFLVPSSIWDQIQDKTWSTELPAPEYWAWLLLEYRRINKADTPSTMGLANILGWTPKSARALLEKYKQFNEENP